MRFLGAKYAKNAFAAMALPCTPLGEHIQCFHRPYAGFKVPTSKGRGGQMAYL